MLILASQSPRRKQLLAQMGLEFDVHSSDVDETVSGEPGNCVAKLACRKAEAVAVRYPNDWVLGADTLVFLDGIPMGKPKDTEEAFLMLKQLSGKKHQVMTGVCLINKSKDVCLKETAVTDVYFACLSDREIRDYIATGEPMDKAGAYAIQGRAGMYVEKICGSHSNVIGLPMSTVREMLKKVGIAV